MTPAVAHRRKGPMADFFVHERGICESADVGTGTRIWAFAHVLGRARIGKDCNLCDGVFVENDVVIGDRVTVKCGVQIWDGVTIADDVFIGPNATFSNDRFPRSKHRPAAFLKTLVHEGASIGANATVLPGLEIGRGAMVGAGAVVTRSVPAYAIAVGNPAEIVGYVDAMDGVGGQSSIDDVTDAQVGVRGVMRHELPLIKDMRGDLSVGEFEKTVPFRPRRYFLVLNVPSREVRGAHAHKTCHQFLICAAGSCSVVVDDGDRRREVQLDKPNIGLFIPAGIWATQYKYSADALLLVFASEHYDASDYIREYGEYLEWIRGRDSGTNG